MKYTIIIFLLIASVTCFCQTNKIVTKKTSGTSGIITDSTKKKDSVVIAQNYYLIAKKNTLQLLYKCVNYPGQATRDDLAMINQWIFSASVLQMVPADTTKQKKPK